jgi:site-specific DNA-methyltransferase (adenine-specific)
MNNNETVKNQNTTNHIVNECGFGLMHGIEDDSVDLIILDPNYQDWDNFLARGLFLDSLRILKPTGNILCFTKQPFDFQLRCEIDTYFRREIVWTFTNGGAWVSKRMPLVSHQKIFHCVKDKKMAFFNERTGIEYAEKTKDFKRSSKVFEGYKAEGRKFKKSNDGLWLRDHLHYNKPHTGKIPSKPQELYDILVRCYCPDGGMVLEPFAGSGNFAKSCIKQGKLFIGAELDNATWEACIDNIKQSKL